MTSAAAVWGLNHIADTEYYFTAPTKKDLTNLPRVSKLYFRNYHLMWGIVCAGVAHTAWLIARKRTTLEDVAVFAAWTSFALVTCAILTAIVIQLCTRPLIFRFQHLE
jgi:hypothetical protein